MKVLIVEDLKVMRRVIANILIDMGIKDILESDDGLEALATLQNEKVDLIITDWLMPNMDGIELVNDIRKDRTLEHIPILMITTVDNKENVIKALKAGINDYIAKPFKSEVLKSKIKKLLSNENVKN